MKKGLLALILITVVVVSCVMAGNSTKVSAQEIVKTEGMKIEESSESTKEANKAASRKKLKDATKVSRKQEEFTFTYRLYVDYLDYLSFKKGHDGEYTIKYTINDERTYTTTMKIEGFELFNTKPTYIAHYIDVEGVTEGDIIKYTYSYMNYYMQYDTPSVESGVQIVE